MIGVVEAPCSLSSMTSQGRGPRPIPEAVDLLQAAAGVSESDRRVMVERVVSFQPPDKPPHKGAVLLGVLLGLFARQFENE
jgi:hypothetical protein